MIDLYAININKTLVDNIFHAYCKALNNDELDDVNKFYKLEDRKRKLSSLLFIKFTIAKYLSLSHTEVSVVKNQYGKPYFANRVDIHFNISHSGEYAVLAVSDSPLGIDVEVRKPINDFLAISENYFSKNEYNFLISSKSSADKKIDLFFDIWTMKEALIKAVGKGLSIPLASFDVPIPNSHSLESEQKITFDKRPYYFNRYALPAKHKVAVCSISCETPTKIKNIDISTLNKICL